MTKMKFFPKKIKKNPVYDLINQLPIFRKWPMQQPTFQWINVSMLQGPILVEHALDCKREDVIIEESRVSVIKLEYIIT